MPVTVFVTAHNHYALQAFEVHALDYLTKPVEPERLKSDAVAGEGADRFAGRAATQEQMKSMLAALSTGAVERKEYPKRLAGSERQAKIRL